MFFNFDDFFSEEELPPFPFDCNLTSIPESHPSYCLEMPPPNPCPESVIERVNINTISYYSPYDEDLVPLATCPGPYIVVPRICGDCTLLGDNVEPDFWVEE